MKYTCQYGHLDKDGQGPLVHPSQSRCDRWVMAQKNKTPTPSTPSPPQSSPLPPTPPTPSPAPAPQSPAATPASASKSGVSVTYNPTTVTDPKSATTTPVQNTDWEATIETTIKFWRVVMTAVGYVVNGLCRFFQIKLMPKEIFEIDQGQEYVIKTNFRGFTTNVLKKVFNAKSPEQADKIVAGLTGVLTFGLVFGKVVLHFWTELPNSPRIKKMKENRIARDAEKKQKALEEARLEARNHPQGAPPPRVSPA